MQECCIKAADQKYRDMFPAGPGIGGGELQHYLQELTKQWGPLTALYADMFTIRTVDQVSLDTAANIQPITCENGHHTHLIVVNERLYYFIWRVNLIAASYWTLDDKLALIPKDPTSNWPGKDQLDQLKIAFDVYLGKRPLSEIGLADFNESFFGAHKAAQLMYKFTVDMAELFVFLHECSHAVPAPDFKASIELPPDCHQVSEKRRARWIDEMQTDASATYILLLAAGSYFANQFNLDKNNSNKIGAGFSFAGIDAALHTLQVLEEVRYGDTSAEKWMIEPGWARHPPIVLRRNTFGFVSQSLAKQVLNQADWEQVRESVSSMVYVRQQMFDGYKATLGE